ncbi:disulfide isomerase-like protein 2-3 [Tanacetum coccineum]
MEGRCGHCKKLAPEWKKASKNFQGKVKLGHVNCDDEKITLACNIPMKYLSSGGKFVIVNLHLELCQLLKWPRPLPLEDERVRLMHEVSGGYGTIKDAMGEIASRYRERCLREADSRLEPASPFSSRGNFPTKRPSMSGFGRGGRSGGYEPFQKEEPDTKSSQNVLDSSADNQKPVKLSSEADTTHEVSSSDIINSRQVSVVEEEATRSGNVDNGLETSAATELEDLLDTALELGLAAGQVKQNVMAKKKVKVVEDICIKTTILLHGVYCHVHDHERKNSSMPPCQDKVRDRGEALSVLASSFSFPLVIE